MSGAEMIRQERIRQKRIEGYNAAHDRGHADELVAAAKAYITTDPRDWPWAPRYFKPSADRTRNLVKAGALIAAAIDADSAAARLGTTGEPAQ